MKLTPELVLWGYTQGLFPMADSRDGEIGWYEPTMRGILPLDGLKVSRSLRKVLQSGRFRCTYNAAFAAVIAACAERESTWISSEIETVYTELHRRGHAQSVEVWEGKDLVGGLYGVSLNAAFFGESMFHRATDASKVALVALVRRLSERRFRLLDTQYVTSHLESLGGIEVRREEYMLLLLDALRRPVTFVDPDAPTGVLIDGARAAV